MAHRLAARSYSELRSLLQHDLDADWVVDLLEVYLGLGVFTANSTLYDEAAFQQAGRGWWTIRGYLNSGMLGYALAVFAWLRHEEQTAVGQPPGSRRRPELNGPAFAIWMPAAIRCSIGKRAAHTSVRSLGSPCWSSLRPTLRRPVWRPCGNWRNARGRAARIRQKPCAWCKNSSAIACRRCVPRPRGPWPPSGRRQNRPWTIPCNCLCSRMASSAGRKLRPGPTVAASGNRGAAPRSTPKIVTCCGRRPWPLRPTARRRGAVPKLRSALMKALGETEYGDVDRLVHALKATAPIPRPNCGRCWPSATANSAPQAEQMLADRHPVVGGIAATGLVWRARAE